MKNKACGALEGLLVQSLYEDLSHDDEVRLSSHLAACPECRQEQAALQALVAGVPAESPQLTHDLVPAVRARLAETESLGWITPWRAAFGATFAALVIASGVVVLNGLQYTPPAEEMAQVTPATYTPDRRAFEQAEALRADRRFGESYAAFKDFIAAYPESALAGEAQRVAADIAFEELRLYPEAYENYLALRANYSEAWRADAENTFRLNLLDESRGADGRYDALHALDQAKLLGNFDAFEDVIHEYPATYAASLAATGMAELSMDAVDETGDGEPVLRYAMEAALDRCNDPIAQNQLKLELGHLVADEADGITRARSLYEEVAASGQGLLARAAEESLARLDTRQ